MPLNDDDDAYDWYDAASHTDLNYPGKGIKITPPGVLGPIPNEDDLLKIAIQPLGPQSGMFVLHMSNNLRVWLNPDRSGRVNNVVAWPGYPANGTTFLYVEGTAVGPGSITLDWTPNWTPNSNPGQTIRNADTLAVYVFQISGPLNVPDDSTYWYEATGGDTTAGASHWNTPQGCGTIVAGAVAPVADSGQWASIKWGAGAIVAQLAYQASPGYIWYRNVNIVQVLVTTPAGGAYFPGETKEVPGVSDGVKWVGPGDELNAHLCQPLSGRMFALSARTQGASTAGSASGSFAGASFRW